MFNEIFNNPKLPSFPSRLQDYRIPKPGSLSFSRSKNQRSLSFSRSPGFSRFLWSVLVSYLSGRKWVSEDLAVISESKEVAGDLITEAVLEQMGSFSSCSGSSGSISHRLKSCPRGRAFSQFWQSDKLVKLEFQELVMFLQHLPTDNWTHQDLEVVLSRAFVWHIVCSTALLAI